MNLITNNPYRIAGVLANTSERALQRQKSKFGKYVSIGKSITSEYDFHILGSIVRDQETLSKAFTRLEQNQDKVRHALFWFFDVNAFDHTAIEYLKTGNRDKSFSIWEKVTQRKEINAKNYTCFLNLSTLQLLSDSKSSFQAGIQTKVQLIESEYFTDFVHLVADQTYRVEAQKHRRLFIDEVVAELEDRYSLKEIVDLFRNLPKHTRTYLLHRLSRDPINRVGTLIAQTKHLRKADLKEAYAYGYDLKEKGQLELQNLHDLLGHHDLQYEGIADQLAKEIMQCGIDYFQAGKEISDPSPESLSLLIAADSITPDPQTKARIQENMAGIEEWARFTPIRTELDFVADQLAKFQRLSNSIPNAETLVDRCAAKLMSIRLQLGSTDGYYLQISGSVVSHCQAMLIRTVNKAQQDPLIQVGLREGLDQLIQDTMQVMTKLGKLDMVPDLRSQFNENRTRLSQIAAQLAVRKSVTPKRDSVQHDELPTWQKWALGIITIILVVKSCVG